MIAVTNVLVVTAWLASAGFITRFLMTTWYRRTAGALTMAFVLSAFMILSLAVTTTLMGQDWPGREWVRLGVYGMMNALLWTGLVTLIRDQHAHRLRRHLTMDFLLTLPAPVRHLIAALAAVGLNWIGTEFVPALSNQSNLTGGILTAALLAAVATFTPLVTSYGVGADRAKELGV